MKAINDNPGIATRELAMAAILMALYLFSVQSVSAVQVSEGVEFQTTGTNTTFIMGNNFTSDRIEVHSTYLTLDTATISVHPSVGTLNFTLFNFSIEYWKWNESCSNPDTVTSHTMGELKTNTPYLVRVNGAIYGHYTSNDSGYVFFTYSGGYSDIVFEMEAGDGGTQTWYLHNDSTMYKEDQTKPQGNIIVSGEGSNIWIADYPAQVDVGFPLNTNNWTGEITFTSALASKHIFKVEVGYSSDGSDFTAGGPQAILTGDGNKKAFIFEASAAAFTVPEGMYLALNITNNNASSDYNVQTGGTWSYISSPQNDPGYPIPELSILMLFSIGLLVLAGYVMLRRRRSA